MQPITPKKRTTFYLEPNVLKEFKNVCQREGVSMSDKVESFIARYVAVHMKGNPQLRLESFFGDVNKKCFFCEGMFPSLYKVEYISGMIAATCSECLKTQKEKTTVKKVLKVI